jgi:tetratricopeptide (TPR) repeat protein
MSCPSASPPCFTSRSGRHRPGCRWRAGFGFAARAALALVCLCLLAPPARAAEPADREHAARDGADPALARLSFIESLYRERDDFRAESEILAFISEAPNSPLRPQVELVRAKLHYRVGRLAEADLMLLSLLDRYPGRPVAADAWTLLGLSWLRQGRLAEAAPLLNREPPLDPLMQPPPYNADRAVGWSTAIPGAGYFVLGEPGRAMTSLSLNVVFLAGTVLSYEQHNVPVALLFLLVEAAFYSGGREAVREEAGRLNERWLQERREAWLGQSSESRLMGTAFELKF